MNKNSSNLILAIVFVVGFLFVWETFVVQKYTKPQAGQASASAAPVSESNATAPSPGSSPASPLATTAAESKQIFLETAREKVTFETKGARVISWLYKETDHWIELVPAEKERATAPLQTFPDLVFNVQQTPASAVFTAQTPSGLRVSKKVELSDAGPFHRITLSLSNPGETPQTPTVNLGWGAGLAKTTEKSNAKEQQAVHAEMRAIAFTDRVLSWKPGVFFGKHIERTEAGAYEWIAVDNHHFLAAIIAPETDRLTRIHVEADKKIAPSIEAVFEPSLAPGATWEKQLELYVGPKNYKDLGQIGRNLRASVDFGFFGPIAKVLLVTLNYFHNLTSNYGAAIILVTLMIQVLVFPLTKTSFKHSVKMKDLQPKIKQLQEQYKSDPKRMQVEMFNFYKKNGMRFMGLDGCFPVLLQIPIFIAFYATLNSAYELRGAEFLWIANLAAKDPTYVLPILMGAGMFLQQKMTAVAMDPAQARMMMFMPLIFTFMFLSLPAGLVLYWVVNSMATIAIQKFIAWRTHHATASPA